MKRNCTGLVLAGGRGTRMGGADKGLVELRGRPLAAHVVDQLRPQVSRMLIGANRNHDRYSALGAPVISDATPDFRGPLAGMLAGLSRCETEWLVTVPCDLPSVPSDLVSELVRVARALRRPAAFAAFDDEPLYVCALLHHELAFSIARSLMRDQLSVSRWLDAQDACAVPFPLPLGARANLNTPEDLAAC
ncbi:MAG TPA: molybdenum cofactor guanylyltransferase MobA [Nevskiaceae bacterium]|nr:molybdenum cofactor guanylyltransferase MobA [Nevskiaceae bacterium]